MYHQLKQLATGRELLTLFLRYDELLEKDLLAVVAVSRARIMAAQNTILNDGNISVRAADTVEQEVVTIGARLVASISESLIDLSCVIACGIWKELVCSNPHDLERGI